MNAADLNQYHDFFSRLVAGDTPPDLASSHFPCSTPTHHTKASVVPAPDKNARYNDHASVTVRDERRADMDHDPQLSATSQFPPSDNTPFTFKKMIHDIYGWKDFTHMVQGFLEKSRKDFRPLTETFPGYNSKSNVSATPSRDHAQSPVRERRLAKRRRLQKLASVGKPFAAEEEVDVGDVSIDDAASFLAHIGESSPQRPRSFGSIATRTSNFDPFLYSTPQSSPSKATFDTSVWKGPVSPSTDLYDSPLGSPVFGSNDSGVFMFDDQKPRASSVSGPGAAGVKRRRLPS